jgi:hypothetical protein
LKIWFFIVTTIDALQVDLDTARQMLRQKNMQIHALEEELGNCFVDAPLVVEALERT